MGLGDPTDEGVGGVRDFPVLRGNGEGVDGELEERAVGEVVLRDRPVAVRFPGLGVDDDEPAISDLVDAIDGASEAEDPTVGQRHH